MSAAGNHSDAPLGEAVVPATGLPAGDCPGDCSAQPPAPPDPAAVRALVARVSECEGLRRSHRLRAFLNYITEHDLAGRREDITELQIAFHVFGRKSDYDSSVHNLVRVQARLLRQKLAEYFAGEGSTEPLIIEIPKGGYVPAFIPREQGPELAAAAAALPAAPRSRAPRWLIALCLFFALTSVWLGWEAWRTRTTEPGAAAPALASSVLESGQRTLVVPPDTGLVIAQFLTGKTISLETYAGAGYRNELLAWNQIPHAQEFFGYLISRRYTDTFAASFYERLLELKSRSSADVELRHPRSIQLRDFAGRNAVLVGSLRSNPWIEAFRNEMTLQFAPNAEGTGEVIRNTRPKPNEPAVLSAMPLRLGSGTGLGLIGVFPNPYGGGRILLVSGTSGGVTEQMAELVTSTSALPLVEKAFGVRDLDKARHFEAAFQVELVGDAPKSWRPLIWRLQEDGPKSASPK